MHVDEKPITAWAHCISPRCPGHNQEQVEALRRETFHTYRDRGGDLPGIEASFVDFLVAKPEDSPCPHCGKAREVSETPRRRYAPLSGHDPQGLLEVNRFDPAKQQEVRQAPPNEALKALEEENAKLREDLMRAAAAVEAKEVEA